MKHVYNNEFTCSSLSVAHRGFGAVLDAFSVSIKQKMSDHFPILIDYVVRNFEIIVHL